MTADETAADEQRQGFDGTRAGNEDRAADEPPAAALVDLDGTVLQGDDLIAGAAEGVATLREAGVNVVFLTNNPLHTPAEWADRLAALGIPADPEAVVTSMASTLAYLREHHADATLLPVAGEPIVEQVRTAGFDTTDDPGEADVVLAGFDEEFGYDDLTRGLRAARNGASVVGTDPDRWVPTGEGPIPGSGAVVNAVAGAAEVDPEAVLGKPGPETAEVALERVGVAAERCLLVGDRLATDVAMGERAGMETALVLTGATDRADLPADPRPDHVIDSLGHVGEVLDGDGGTPQ